MALSVFSQSSSEFQQERVPVGANQSLVLLKITADREFFLFINTACLYVVCLVLVLVRSRVGRVGRAQSAGAGGARGHRRTG